MYGRLQTSGSVMIDAALGVRTTQRERKPESPPVMLYHRPFGWTQVARLFHRYPLQPDDVLIDIGSGAGRIVLFAATRFRCKKVIGVERDERLDSIARRNMRDIRLRTRTPIELVRADALEHHMPDDVTVVYFYNAFDGEAFNELVDKVAASIERRPRRLTFLYANPVAAPVLAADPRYVLVDRIRSWRPDPEWARSCSVNVYEVSHPSRST
jgi:hypothetical protein